MHDVAILDNIVLAFQSPLARILGATFAIITDEILISDHFSADESFLEVGMDYTGSTWCLSTFYDGPSSNLFFTKL